MTWLGAPFPRLLTPLRVVLDERARVLAHRVRTSRGCYQRRDGAHLTLLDAAGRRGLGEAAPLPGHSRESLSEASAALRRLDPEHLARAATPGAPTWHALARAARLLPRQTPSARFALESALLDLAARTIEQPAWRLLRAKGPPPPALSLAELLPPESDAALERARRALSLGVRTFKLKVVEPHDDVSSLARALRTLDPSVSLRLDCNQSLAHDDLEQALRRLGALEPEWVEEPVPPERLSALGGTGLPVALDESLDAPGAWRRLRTLLGPVSVVAVVLKPALLGGLARAARLAHEARTAGLDVAVSHLLGGPVSRAAECALALAVGSAHRAQGLGPGADADAWPEVAGLSPARVVPTEVAGLGVSPPEAG